MGIIPFNFHNNDIRVIQDDNGEPWFIAMDVAEILNYSDTNKMTSKLDSDEVQNRQISGFGNRGITLINESGLYSVILRSDKPNAKPFKKWVTSEVLPSIRKTGSYSISRPKLPVNYIEALSALIESEKAKEIEQRKVAALTTIVDNEFGYSSILRAAQHLGIHENIFNWRPLKAEAQLLGMEVKKVPSPRFDYQLLYPIKAFENCYPQYDFMDLKPETILENTNKEINQAAYNHISGVA